MRVRLKEILAERGMTQKELAQLTGIRESTLSQIIGNKVEKINLVYLASIMKVLEIKDFNEVFVFTE